MTLPPERISIKRRRQDDPVDTLILEPGPAHDKKRRFTDFYFQRLHRDDVGSGSAKPSVASSSQTKPDSVAQEYKALGIPVVRSTAPGDEKGDFARYRATQKNRFEDTNEIVTATKVGDSEKSSFLQNRTSSSDLRRQAKSARRFHLTRDLSSPLKPNSAGGIRRSKISLRPPLATFIEHRNSQERENQSIYRGPPVDRVVELRGRTASAAVEHETVTEDAIGKRSEISTFQKPPSSAFKRGHSIRDDPATWDLESDQLANELAALAFDIDPADATEPPHVVPAVVSTTPSMISPNKPANEAMAIDDDSEFIFETYVRVKYDPKVPFSSPRHDSEVGVLVIDDENEDLWEKYIHSDDDDEEWDEEDEDSNAEDNPRNEYPDDEVSSDDEFGRNTYKYRRNASEDEEYDDTREQW